MTLYLELQQIINDNASNNQNNVMNYFNVISNSSLRSFLIDITRRGYRNSKIYVYKTKNPYYKSTAPITVLGVIDYLPRNIYALEHIDNIVKIYLNTDNSTVTEFHNNVNMLKDYFINNGFSPTVIYGYSVCELVLNW